MTAGLPGTGIGGIFYIACALSMPLFELVKTINKESSIARWKFVMKHFLTAIAIFAGFWVMGWMLVLSFNALDINVLSEQKDQIRNIFRFQPFLISLAVLGFVLLTVQIAAFIVKRKKS